MGEYCSALFTDLKFEDLTCADPPDEKGVYIIKIKSRVERLSKIGNCPMIYIGSGRRSTWKPKYIEGSYREFSLRHTAMYPIWVLLYFN